MNTTTNTSATESETYKPNQDDAAAEQAADLCGSCGGSPIPGIARWLCDCEPPAVPARGPVLVAWVAWVTWGSVRGEGPTRATEEQAERDARADAHGCRRQGGYSDRQVYGVDADGWARTSEGGYVWPHGRTSRALQVDLSALSVSQAVRS